MALTTRWFAKPNGNWDYGVGVPRPSVIYFDNDSTWGWYTSPHELHSGYPTAEEAMRAAEEGLRHLLDAVVSLMGGHVVWPVERH